MVDERSSLTKAIDKTKDVFRSANYGATNDQKSVDHTDVKQKYRKLRFFKKLWKWRSVKKTKEELLEEGPKIKQKHVTITTYALCFIMMIAGLSVKMD